MYGRDDQDPPCVPVPRRKTNLDTLWATTLAAEDASAYDQFELEAPSGHFAQTRAWAPVAARSRPSHVRYFVARDAGRIVGTALVLRAAAGPLPLPFATIDRGPVCREPADVPRVLEALRSAARRRGIVRLTAMPYWTGGDATLVGRALSAAGYRDVQRADGAHATSLRLDLREDPQALLAGGDRAQLRRLRREASRAGATVRPGGRADLEVHRRMVRERFQAGRQAGRDRSTAWYDALWSAMLAGAQRGGLFVCEHEGAPVGTVVALRHGPLATYAYGATSDGPAPFSKSVLPLVAAIEWARALGCAQFDLGGVPQANDTDPKRAHIAEYKGHFSKTRVDLVREHSCWF